MKTWDYILMSNTKKTAAPEKIQRTLSDMESDGVYFSQDVKEKLKKDREELFCEYSGLPSVKAYQK